MTGDMCETRDVVGTPMQVPIPSSLTDSHTGLAKEQFWTGFPTFFAWTLVDYHPVIFLAVLATVLQHLAPATLQQVSNFRLHPFEN